MSGVPIVKLISDRRSIMLDRESGEPRNVTMAIGRSESTPGRLRIAFVLPLGDGDEAVLLGPPFRLEAN